MILLVGMLWSMVGGSGVQLFDSCLELEFDCEREREREGGRRGERREGGMS